ncbi:MAG: J domain-containing protein [Wolbachia endosymbiont of Homalodisca vitripennis]|nr:DnaJ domain-containing protein [Wolbachia endosymbiont of Homalodisca vitripennis]MCJ7454066.1 J domain-containing protein [Wolbachia endosymbiont of Homalodisca vitripennis]MCJ7476019.1 J domain-containing protein [Wolbachia endosymbiont of Homalodisca vitripennis]
MVNSDIGNIKKKFSKQYCELSLKYHPDKNPGNKEAEEQFKVIAKNKSFFGEFVIEPLEKGLNKRNNLMKELRGKLWNHSYEELQKHLDDKSRNRVSNKQQSINNNIIAYSKYSSYSNLLGNLLVFFTSIAFFISNGVTYNVPLVVGFFAPILAVLVLGSAIKTIYTRNRKEFNNQTNILLLFNFDQECKDFSESDRTKLKWIKNSIILSNIICTSLMFSGVGLDLVANGFGITNSMILSGLLLSLPFTLLIVTSPILNAASEYILKKTAINSIEEQFKGSDPLVEQPDSTINPDSVHAHGREQVV